MGRVEVHTGIEWGNLKGKYLLKDQGLDKRILLKRIFKTLDRESLTGLIWLRIGTGGGLL
jgi:hypothetical protein